MEKAYSSTDFYHHQIWVNKNSTANKHTDCFYKIDGNDSVYRLSAESDLNCISNGTLRITALFLELLNRQFPVTSIKQKMTYRFPVDFAGALSIHVNHLNRCLKDTTSKTTSQLVAEKVIEEAQMLLTRTDWNICEIGYCLKFEEVPHFINFFKKYKNISPTAYRKVTRLKHHETLKSSDLIKTLF
jgi:AraC-like DNA-binding protein